MVAEGTAVIEGNQVGESHELGEGDGDDTVTVSRETLRKMRYWLKRVERRLDNHDLRCSIKTIDQLMSGDSPSL